MKTASNLAINFFAGLIPEVALSYFLMQLFNEGWSFFWLVYIGIQGFYFIVWIFRSLISWLLYKLIGKKQLIEKFYETLVSREYPDPHTYYSGDAMNYFEEVVYEPDGKIETRINAATLMTEHQTLKGVGQLQFAYRIERAAREAIQMYMRKNFSGTDGRGYFND